MIYYWSLRNTKGERYLDWKKKLLIKIVGGCSNIYDVIWIVFFFCARIPQYGMLNSIFELPKWRFTLEAQAYDSIHLTPDPKILLDKPILSCFLQPLSIMHRFLIEIHFSLVKLVGIKVIIFITYVSDI